MPAPPSITSQLQERIQGLERQGRAAGVAMVSSGWQPLDQRLPERGFFRGSLVEWLEGGPGSGAATLALGTAREACRDGGVLVVVDRTRQVYPPALAAWGWNLSHVVFLHPASLREEAWAWDQALNCPSVGAVWGHVERIDARVFRRWQLSAERVGVLGLLVRPAAFRQQASWAGMRLLVQPQRGRDGRRFQVQLLRGRGTARSSVEFELDEWTGHGHQVRQHDESHSRTLAARLAHPAPGTRTPGAGRTSSRAVGTRRAVQ